jgi:hypothetical protein
VPENRSKRFHEWLDGLDFAASTLAVLLLAALVGGLFGVVSYILTHWPAGYGWGPQGEAFYLGLAIVLVFGWVLAQISWFVRRRRRTAWTFRDGSEIPSPKIEMGNSGFSIHWGQPPRSGDSPDGSRTFSWNLPIARGPIRAFRLDDAALRAARTARVGGASWDEVCRQVNPEWLRMDIVDRELYQRALQDALEHFPPSEPS